VTLTRFKWVEYVPDIGNNRELEAPLTLEVRTGLTRKELQAYAEAVAKTQEETVRVASKEGVTGEEVEAALVHGRAALTDVLREHVRIKGSHSIDGQPLEHIGHYLEAISYLATHSALRELLSLVPKLNTLTEDEALFSGRLSGGLATTPRRSAAKKDEKTGAR